MSGLINRIDRSVARGSGADPDPPALLPLSRKISAGHFFPSSVTLRRKERSDGEGKGTTQHPRSDPGQATGPVSLASSLARFAFLRRGWRRADGMDSREDRRDTTMDEWLFL
jgi:hypothetical protein